MVQWFMERWKAPPSHQRQDELLMRRRIWLAEDSFQSSTKLSLDLAVFSVDGIFSLILLASDQFEDKSVWPELDIF